MSLNIQIHKTILLKVLKDIFTDSSIGPVLGFKGGTAAYLFYELGRFSVDLDLDLLDLSKKELVFRQLENILKGYGILKEARIKRYSLFFLLSYDQKMAGAQNIKVEVSLRNFGSRYDVKSYLGIAMKVMKHEDMIAHKLVALLERMGSANRDIFDVWFFLQKDWPINQTIIEQRSGVSISPFLDHCIKALEGLKNRNMLAGMGELLDAKQKVWVKTKLLSETIFLLKLRMSIEK